MAGFTFPSLTRSMTHVYQVTSNALEHSSGRNNDIVAYWLSEFPTFNDGVIQHGPSYAVQIHNMGDVLASLATFLLTNATHDHKDTVLAHWPKADRIDPSLVLFLADLRPGLEKPVYFNKQERKR